MACTTKKRFTGRGTKVKMQPCVDNSTLSCNTNFTLINGVCVHDTDPIANPDEVPTCTPGTLMDTTPAGPWVSVACTYEVTPPGIEYDTTTGELCLDDSGAPPVELGDESEDNPGFVNPFAKTDAEFQLMRGWSKAETCLLFWFEYSDGGHDFFYGQIKVNRGQTINRTDFMKNDVTLLRTSEIYDIDTDVPVDCNFSCTQCTECN